MPSLDSHPQPLLSPKAQSIAPAERLSPQREVTSKIYQALRSVCDKIAPVWPLKDYVAVNPLLGFTTQEFFSARNVLQAVSDVELLMSGDYYRQQYKEGAFSKADIDTAIDELVADGVAGAERINVNQVLNYLNEPTRQVAAAEVEFVKSFNPDRELRAFSEILDIQTGSDWTRIIRDEISKHCATHYDQGQAVWLSRWQSETLYQAWRSVARYDRTFEILGVGGFRSFVKQLPEQPQTALVILLKRLNVPEKFWPDFLLCEALTIPGWMAWTRYQHHQASQQGEENDDLAGLLAIRLAYEVALSEQFDFQVHWPSIAKYHASLLDDVHHRKDESLIRYALLRASEVAFRNRLVLDVATGRRKAGQAHTSRNLAQVVFCIDVRSERIRRQLEAASTAVETFGFAGFFGLPIEFVELGETQGSSQVPALISPKFKVYEELEALDDESPKVILKRRSTWRCIRKAWKAFQTSAVSAFAYVETAGLFYGPKLIARTLRGDLDWPSRFDGVPKAKRDRVAPSVSRLEHQGVGKSQQVDLAESILRGIGIVDNFARLIVFCGHGSQVENNPLKAGLDCGACGGHSGEANARLAAMLFNQQHVRQTLVERGIRIPEDTLFVAALHNTTTDKLDFFDTHQIPTSHQGDLERIQRYADLASQQARCERLAVLPGKNTEDLLRRSQDWSEVRPEWGLAGNAAFIAAPRELTEEFSLDGRVFLHSYDHNLDPHLTVLEQIMSAPLVVANWINMQYYASTVDPIHFGSGNKTVHNVVGQFGIFSGNGGDLKTGLPWQSVHDGERYQHHPLRLLAVIAAPRKAIQEVILKHQNVTELLANGWMHLVAIEDGNIYRYSQRQEWQEIATMDS